MSRILDVLQMKKRRNLLLNSLYSLKNRERKKKDRIKKFLFTLPRPSICREGKTRCCSVAKLCPTLQPHGLQHTRLPCPSPSPRVCSNSCPLSWWCHPTISSSVTLFSSCLQSFPTSASFPINQFFESGGHSIVSSALASVLLMNIQGWFLLELIGFISLLSEGLPEKVKHIITQKMSEEVFEAQTGVHVHSLPGFGPWLGHLTFPHLQSSCSTWGPRGDGGVLMYRRPGPSYLSPVNQAVRGAERDLQVRTLSPLGGRPVPLPGAEAFTHLSFLHLQVRSLERILLWEVLIPDPPPPHKPPKALHSLLIYYYYYYLFDYTWS